MLGRLRCSDAAHEKTTSPRRRAPMKLLSPPRSLRLAVTSVQTQRQASFPIISPAAALKLVSLPRLPALTRHIDSSYAAVFANVWSTRAGGEHISAWRNRPTLVDVVKLRARHANTGASTSARFPGAKGAKEYQDGDAFVGVVAMGGLAEEEGVLASLDFSRWAGPNPPLA